MQSIDFKKIRPHLLLIVGFAVLSLIYCYPQIQGMVLNQHDYISWKAMSHEIKAYHDSTGKNVLWTNSMFGGMPSYTIDVPESHNYPAQIQTVLELLGKPAYFFFIAMLCFYLLMQALNINKWLSAVGAVAYAFSTYNPIIIGAGHETKMLALGYLPAVIGGLILLYKSKWWTGIPLFCLSLLLMIGTNHYQIIYYTLIICLFLVVTMLVLAIKQGKVKQFVIASAIALFCALVALGAGMANFLSIREYTNTTMRGGESELTLNHHDKDKKSGGLDKDYAFSWSNGIGETFCMLVPKLYGGSNSEQMGESSNSYKTLTNMGVPEESASQFCEHLPLYWGPQPFVSGPVYFGAIICFLFVLGLFVVKSPHKWWIVGVSALAIIMSWGKNFPAFNYFLFDHLPMYNKFRTPSMILVIPELLFPLLGIWGMSEILNGKLKNEDVWKNVKKATIITGGLCLLLGLGGRMFLSYRSEANDANMTAQYAQMFGNNQVAANKLMSAIREDRASVATNSALLSALYIALAAGLFWRYSKDKLKTNVLIGGIALLVVVDLVSVDSHYLGKDDYIDKSDFEAVFEPRPVDRQIMQDPDPYYRVLDLSRNTYNDAIQTYFHKCVGGYSPAKMEIYQDLIDEQMNQGTGKFNKSVLDMLNTKYIIFGQNGKEMVQRNQDACGNAWFVNNIKWVNSADEAMLSLNAPSLGDTTQMPNAFDPKSTAVIRNEFKDKLGNATIGKDSSAYIKLTKYGLDDLSFESNNSKEGLGVFSDIWYPYGWEAYVDGKQTPIIRTDYVLRAIKIPAGKHVIEFHFRPKSYLIGDKISLISSFVVFIIILLSLYQIFKNKKEPEQKQA